MKNSIRVARAEVRMTQQQLADAVGVSRQTVNAIESGKFIPSTLLALKRAGLCRNGVEVLFTVAVVFYPAPWLVFLRGPGCCIFAQLGGPLHSATRKVSQLDIAAGSSQPADTTQRQISRLHRDKGYGLTAARRHAHLERVGCRHLTL